MDFKTRTLLVVGLFMLATFCTNGVNGGKGGKGKGKGGKGAVRIVVKPPAVNVAAWTTRLRDVRYDPDVAKATAKFAFQKLVRGKGAGKGRPHGRPDFDPIEDRGGIKAHTIVPDGKAENKYYSFWYDVKNDAELAAAVRNGSGNGARVVVEVDRAGTPTGRYWMTEHPPAGLPGYQNWSLPATIF